MPFKFEKLDIWKIAIEVADEVHNLIRSFPKEEMFSLTSQIKRAADSISLNIAEGSTGQSNPEQLKFIGYSQRSALEVVNCLYLAITGNKKKLYLTRPILICSTRNLKYRLQKFRHLKILLKTNKYLRFT